MQVRFLPGLPDKATGTVAFFMPFPVYVLDSIAQTYIGYSIDLE
jgi:hypothetical protein